jgi:alkanesulfonate monooxygenase SsuD/methylene tetrahydromethanopterin reductase-like flavin-dependent oxidoreductase (luciferase family)
VASRGPLHIPPSEQGQPVIFHAGGSPNGHALAGRCANALIGAAFTIEDARAHRNALRNAAERSGRNPDEVKFFAGLMTTIADDRRSALDRRAVMTGRTFPQRVAYLGQMLGLRLDPSRLGEPLSTDQLSAAQPSSSNFIRALCSGLLSCSQSPRQN